MHRSYPQTVQAIRAAIAAAGLVLGLMPTSAVADCMCRLQGRDVPLGATACLAPNGEAALYKCEMNLNITSWNRIADGCPTALLQQAPPSSTAPVHHAGGAGHTGHSLSPTPVLASFR